MYLSVFLFHGHFQLKKWSCFSISISIDETRYRRRSCFIRQLSDWIKANIRCKHKCVYKCNIFRCLWVIERRYNFTLLFLSSFPCLLHVHKYRGREPRAKLARGPYRSYDDSVFGWMRSEQTWNSYQDSYLSYWHNEYCTFYFESKKM